jgi:ribosomal protein S18 acetylase RimI-like enzyme
MPLTRPARADDALAMARVHVDTWRTTYGGIVPDEHLANLSYERACAGWLEVLVDPQGGTHAFVGEGQEGQIVALASCGPLLEPLEDFDAEMYVLYILKSFQGMGYGRLLLRQAAQDLISRGYSSLIVWVLKDNPACGFYERLGGRRVAEKFVEIGGKQLLDVGFAWPDLHKLAGD